MCPDIYIHHVKQKSGSHRQHLLSLFGTEWKSPVSTTEPLSSAQNKADILHRTSNTQRQLLFSFQRPRIHKGLKCNVVYAVKCSEECKDLLIGETKQLLSPCMSTRASKLLRNIYLMIMRYMSQAEKTSGLKEVSRRPSMPKWSLSSLNRGGGFETPSVLSLQCCVQNHTSVLIDDPACSTSQAGGGP